jgi:hypothetical protein
MVTAAGSSWTALVLVFHFAHANIRPIFDYDQRAKGSIVFATAAVWDDRRAAVAKLLHLDGVVEAARFLVHRQDVASIFDVERMAASFAAAAPTKKKS